LRGELESLQKKTKAWSAVDKHEKTTDVKYATGALEHLKAFQVK
jgi:hypothetical protein